MHYLLMYDYGEDAVARRAPHREAHLALAREWLARGLLMGGAFADPVDGAALLFRVADASAVEEFARQDPYVTSGLVTRWRVRPWTVVVGPTSEAATTGQMAQSRPAAATETAAVTNRTNAPHYVWGEVCEGWRLLDRPDLSVIQERIPPDRGEVTHYHERARQLFFVLEGELAIETGAAGVVSHLHAGDSLEVAPRQTHRVWNRGTGDAVVLVVSAPTTQGDRVTL